MLRFQTPVRVDRFGSRQVDCVALVSPHSCQTSEKRLTAKMAKAPLTITAVSNLYGLATIFRNQKDRDQEYTGDLIGRRTQSSS